MKQTILAILALMIFAGSAHAADSMQCVKTGWGEVNPQPGYSNRSDRKHDYHEYVFENRCGWDVRILWRSTQFGEDLCGRLNYANSLDSGETYTTMVRQIEVGVTPKLRFCAEAKERGHPDYDTCPHDTYSDC